MRWTLRNGGRTFFDLTTPCGQKNSDRHDDDTAQYQSLCMFLGERPLLNEEWNQRSENRAEADDDRVGDTQTKALHRNAEKNLRDPPAGTQQYWNGKLLQGQSAIRFEQTAHESQGEYPGNDHKRDHTENKPHVLPFPITHKLRWKHATAGHQPRDHYERDSRRQRMPH